MSLSVLEPGLHTRVVDAGRPGWRGLGVPLGGAFDLSALALGNALLGNSPTSAALEITLLGPVLRAEDDIGAVVFGAPFQIDIDGRPVRAGRPFLISRGETLRVGPTPTGARGYLCVVGGFQGEELLGSRSGFEPIRAGEVLECSTSRPPRRFLAMPDSGYYIRSGWPTDRVRAILGGQADHFDLTNFFGPEFQVLPESDRMGIRLSGSSLARVGEEMISEPVGPGTVQVTHSGQCIVLGPDGQTVGGYPKIAHVIRADRDILAQLRPGSTIHFESVAPEQAEQIGREADRCLKEWLTRLQLTLTA